MCLFQIPNFLHLTPAAIKKHCEALKRNVFSYFVLGPPPQQSSCWFFYVNYCWLVEMILPVWWFCCQRSAQSGLQPWTLMPSVTNSSPSKWNTQTTSPPARHSGTPRPGSWLSRSVCRRATFLISSQGFKPLPRVDFDSTWTLHSLYSIRD